MLYLLKPDRTLKWVDLPATSTVRQATENRIDLSGLPWEPSERSVDNRIVRWALRHGVACTTGLVLHAPDLTVVDHPDGIRAAHKGVLESRENLAGSRWPVLLERLIPGSAEYGRELDAKVDLATADALEEAEAELQKAMAAQPDPSLIRHWSALGGQLPNPL